MLAHIPYMDPMGIVRKAIVKHQQFYLKTQWLNSTFSYFIMFPCQRAIVG